MDGRCDDTMVMGGRCISQKEGIMKEGDEKIFQVECQNISRRNVVQDTKSKIRSSNDHPKRQPSIRHEVR